MGKLDPKNKGKNREENTQKRREDLQRGTPAIKVCRLEPAFRFGIKL